MHLYMSMHLPCSRLKCVILISGFKVHLMKKRRSVCVYMCLNLCVCGREDEGWEGGGGVV